MQLSTWNFKGKKVPLITSEKGVGRGIKSVNKFIPIQNRGTQFTT